jgi:hypothetical protein
VCQIELFDCTKCIVAGSKPGPQRDAAPAPTVPAPTILFTLNEFEKMGKMDHLLFIFTLIYIT